MSVLKRFFGDGFRVFFLAAGLFGVVSMLVWEGFLTLQAMGGEIALPTAAAPHLWHAHEMIFGFASAALGGFFLTAVPNWTGARSAPHIFIAIVSGLWLLGRVAVWHSASLPPVLVAVADLAFVPVLAAKVLTQLLQRPKLQQMIFVLMLTLFWIGNLMVHLEWMGITDDTLWAGLRVGLTSLGALVMILGGRVTPGFTKNAMVQSGRLTGWPQNPGPLAAVAIVGAISQPVGYILGVDPFWLGPLALIAGVAGLVRVALWRGIWARGRPILWVLHLSYAMNALGFAALGLSGLGQGSEIAALHLLGIGGVGGMTLAMMSRAALGHSGRALVAPRPIAVAYALVPVAALTRFAGASIPALYYPGILTAGALWILAFGLYSVALWPVVWGPRQSRAAKETSR